MEQELTGAVFIKYTHVVRFMPGRLRHRHRQLVGITLPRGRRLQIYLIVQQQKIQVTYQPLSPGREQANKSRELRLMKDLYSVSVIWGRHWQLRALQRVNGHGRCMSTNVPRDKLHRIRGQLCLELFLLQSLQIADN